MALGTLGAGIVLFGKLSNPSEASYALLSVLIFLLGLVLWQKKSKNDGALIHSGSSKKLHRHKSWYMDDELDE